MDNIVYIKSVTLENIQSQRIKTTYYLSPHLNCFEGRNNTGKTAINRAFQLFAREHNQQKLLGILNREADEGFVQLDRSDDTYMKVVLTREKKRGRKEGVSLEYTYGNQIDGTIYSKWDGYFPEITDILGWVTLRSDQGIMALNFKKSGDQLFIDTPGTVNTAILQELCKVEDLDARQFNLKVAIDRETEVIDLIYKDIAFQNAKLQTLKWTDVDWMEEYRTFLIALKKDINDIHCAINLAQQLKTYLNAKIEESVLKKVNQLITCRLVEAQKQACKYNESIRYACSLVKDQIARQTISDATNKYIESATDTAKHTEILLNSNRYINRVLANYQLKVLSQANQENATYQKVLSAINHSQLSINKAHYLQEYLSCQYMQRFSKFADRAYILKQLESIIKGYKHTYLMDTLYSRINTLSIHYNLQLLLEVLVASEDYSSILTTVKRLVDTKITASCWKAIKDGEIEESIMTEVSRSIQSANEIQFYTKWLSAYESAKCLLSLLEKSSNYVDIAYANEQILAFRQLEKNQEVLNKAVELIPVCPTCGKVLYTGHDHIIGKVGE